MPGGILSCVGFPGGSSSLVSPEKADPGGASTDCGPDASPLPERAVLGRRAHVPGPLLHGSAKPGRGTCHTSLSSELVLRVGEIQEKSTCNKLQIDKIIKSHC